ncbi:hypothetical protein QIY50_11440 [Pseudomonas putida]|nr:hypothetical protein QIY50_11440 [Pseudomonas putida]
MLQSSFGLDADWIKNETPTTQHRLAGMKTVVYSIPIQGDHWPVA